MRDPLIWLAHVQNTYDKVRGWKAEDSPKQTLLLSALALEVEAHKTQQGTIKLRGLPIPPIDFRDALDVENHFKIYELRRVLPYVVQLKRDKMLHITRLVTNDRVWTREKELALQAALKAPRWPYLKGGMKDPNAVLISNLRDKRHGSGVFCSILFTRGPFTIIRRVHNFKDVGGYYLELRKAISHARVQSRHAVHAYLPPGSKIGGVRSTPNYWLGRAKASSRKPLAVNKSPKTQIRHIGIELEFCTKANKDMIADALLEAGVADYCTLQHDGSLRPSEKLDQVHELAVLLPEKGYAPYVETICKVLKTLGGYVNKTCGLHVHLDMRTRDPERAYFRLVQAQELLFRMVPEERKHNKYCRRNFVHSEYDPDDESRYWAINAGAYNRHKTLEVRLHSGTLNALKIVNWARLLLIIIAKANLIAYKNIEVLQDVLEIPEDLRAYVKLRVDKFNQEGQDYEDEHVVKIYDRSLDKSPVCNCDLCSQVEILEA